MMPWNPDARYTPLDDIFNLAQNNFLKQGRETKARIAAADADGVFVPGKVAEQFNLLIQELRELQSLTRDPASRHRTLISGQVLDTLFSILEGLADTVPINMSELPPEGTT